MDNLLIPSHLKTYIHSLAYSYGLVSSDSEEFSTFQKSVLDLQQQLLRASSMEQALAIISQSTKERLEVYDPTQASQLVDVPRTRVLQTSLGEFIIYMSSHESIGW